MCFVYTLSFVFTYVTKTVKFLCFSNTALSKENKMYVYRMILYLSELNKGHYTIGWEDCTLPLLYCKYERVLSKTHIHFSYEIKVQKM